MSDTASPANASESAWGDDPLFLTNIPFDVAPYKTGDIILFHGSGGQNLDSILKHGLMTSEQAGTSNYGNTLDVNGTSVDTSYLLSRRDQVYLAQWKEVSDMTVVSHALHGALTKEHDKVALLVAVRLHDLDQANLYPDEDSLVEWSRIRCPPTVEFVKEDVLKTAKDHVDLYKDLWWKSLTELHETVAHRGVILPSSISTITAIQITGVISDLYHSVGFHFAAYGCAECRPPSYYRNIVENWFRGKSLSSEQSSELLKYLHAVTRSGWGNFVNADSWQDDLTYMQDHVPISIDVKLRRDEQLDLVRRYARGEI